MESRTFTCRIGSLTMTAEKGDIISIKLNTKALQPSSDSPSDVLEKSEKQLIEYLDGKLKIFDLPIRLIGTPFQIAVWRALQEIPYGTTLTYGEIATRIGRPKASRAVGMACNRNPLLIVVPCHRAVGAGGKLTGFACGLEIKRELLEIEQI